MSPKPPALYLIDAERFDHVYAPRERALIEQHLACLPIESLPLTQAAGAVLRENVYAERDQPPFDRVAMDGIAIVSERVTEQAGRLRICGTQNAGDPPQKLTDPGGCIRTERVHRDRG